MTISVKKQPHKPDRMSFIGGSDARTIMGKDEKALHRLWREKRGEAATLDLSGVTFLDSTGLGVVLRQFPARGTLSSYDKVTLVLPKALHGIVPRLIGLRLGRAQARLERLHLKWKVSGNPSPGAKVIAQTPGPRRAAERGLIVTLVVQGG